MSLTLCLVVTIRCQQAFFSLDWKKTFTDSLQCHRCAKSVPKGENVIRNFFNESKKYLWFLYFQSSRNVTLPQLTLFENEFIMINTRERKCIEGKAGKNVLFCLFFFRLGRELNFPQFFVLKMAQFTSKFQNFPPNTNISREGASQFPHFFLHDWGLMGDVLPKPG